MNGSDRGDYFQTLEIDFDFARSKFVALMKLNLTLALVLLPIIGRSAVVSLVPDSSPVAARDAARKLEKPVRIVVADGTYEMAAGLDLGGEDSGVTWEAAPGAHPVFSGGRKISGWKQADGGLWKADVPKVREGKLYFEQLFVNGQRATRARSPNVGFFNMRSHASADIFPPPSGMTNAAQWSRELAFHSFVVKQNEFDEIAKIADAERDDVALMYPHTWSVHHYRIKETKPSARAVLTDGPKGYEFLYYEADGRFWIENFRAALDQLGEWFLNRNGELLYMPRPGEDMTKAEVVAPVAESLLKMDGASNVTFSGISFQHQNWLMGPKGYGEGQAAISIPGAIELQRCVNVKLENCEIAHVGGYGIAFNQDVHNASLVHSHLHDLGGGGVKIGPFGGSPHRNPTDHVTIDDCIIQHGGRIFPEAVGIIITHSGDNAITHCDIGDFFYSAISIGWVWGYGESLAQRNRVEDNHLHHLGWGVISDMGGVYLLGPAFGTVIRGNHIHDIASYRYGGWGLYTDEGSTGVLMENNLVHDTSESAFHQHYGYYNTIRNNILAFGAKAQLQRTRAEKHLSYIFENNILVWDPAVKLLDGSKYNWDFPEKTDPGYPRETYIFRNNLYGPLGGSFTNKLADNWTWDEWKKSGRDSGSIIADPKFADISKRDFTIAPDSPAIKLGFKPWDLAQAGVRGDSWRAIAAATVNYPDFAAKSKPWPSPKFEMALETFEYMGIGQCTLPKQILHMEGKGDSIGVTEEAASPMPPPGGAPEGRSKRSLRILGSPTTQQSYNPHVIIDPKWTNGEQTVAFDAMARTNADWYFELRVSDAQYVPGPSLAWRNGRVFAEQGDSKPVIDLPADQWARFEVTATPGVTNWSLRVTRADGQAAEMKNLNCGPGWAECHFAGWINLVKTNSARYIDNIRFEPH